MTIYYIKLNDHYLQVDDRQTPFFSDERIGELYSVVSEQRAKQLLSVLFKGIPYEMFTLEERPTHYQHTMRIGTDILVWCDDSSWHNQDDLAKLKCKPVLYKSVGEANEALKILPHLGNPYVSVVLW